MSLWDTLKGWIDQDSTKLTYLPIDPSHVDRQIDATPLQAGRHYFRLRLVEMFLQKQVAWFTTWYPAVHSLVGCTFGNQRREIPYIADSTRVGMQQNQQGDVIARNFILTPTLPFNGGTVDLDAGLMAIQGQNNLNKFIGVLGNFAGILAVPQLSAVLGIAQPLANGMQELFGVSGNQFHLGVHQSYAAEDLKPGYIALIRAPQSQVETGKLWVVNDELREGRGKGEGEHEAFQRADHMLLRIEGFEERDDWDSLTTIQEPFLEARRALKDFDDQKAQFHLRTALVRALEAPELTTADRRRVVTALKERFEQDKQDLGVAGLVGDGTLTLAGVMERAMPVDAALQERKPSYAEVFGSSN